MDAGRKSYVLRWGVFLLVLLLSAGISYAGGFDGAIGGMRSLYGSLARLLQIIIGIGALFVLVLIVFRILQGDKEAAAKLGWWLVGLAFGFTMITVLAEIAKNIA